MESESELQLSAELIALRDSSGYPIEQKHGQRKFGPPTDWEGPAPKKGCEVFIGSVPRDCFEDQLVPIFERIGKIYEFRLMMDFSGLNRGFAFCVYPTKELAKRAIKELDRHEIRKGTYLGVCPSLDNCRLFIGGLPKSKQEQEIREEMEKVTDGVVKVIVYPSAADKSKNRGFAFVEYVDHAAASLARRKLIPGKIQLWGHNLAVDWAEPETMVDEETMSKVKILYARNLMLATTEETLEKVFNEAGLRRGPDEELGEEQTAAGGANGEDASEPEATVAVERVKKIKDYAFIHFLQRKQALRALKALNGTILEGAKIEVCLSKPPNKDNNNQAASVAAASPTFFDPQSLSMHYAVTGLNRNVSVPGLGMHMRGRGRGRGAAGSRGGGRAGYNRPPKMPFYKTAHEVAVPGLHLNTYAPNKIARTVEEAKSQAAEYMLMSLGVPQVEGTAFYPGGQPLLHTAGNAPGQPAAAMAAHAAATAAAAFPQNGPAGLASPGLPSIMPGNPAEFPFAYAAAAAGLPMGANFPMVTTALVPPTQAAFNIGQPLMAPSPGEMIAYSPAAGGLVDYGANYAAAAAAAAQAAQLGSFPQFQ